MIEMAKGKEEKDGATLRIGSANLRVGLGVCPRVVDGCNRTLVWLFRTKKKEKVRVIDFVEVRDEGRVVISLVG